MSLSTMRSLSAQRLPSDRGRESEISQNGYGHVHHDYVHGRDSHVNVHESLLCLMALSLDPDLTQKHVSEIEMTWLW